VQVALLDHHGGRVEDRVHVLAVGVAPGVGLVGAEGVVENGRAVLDRLLHVGHDRQLVVVDGDQLGRVERLLPALGHDHRDRLAGEADLALGQDLVLGDARLVALGDLLAEGERRHRPRGGQGVGELAVELGPGPDREDAGGRLGLLGVDRQDVGVGDRAAHDDQVDHARQHDVVGVAALAGDELRVLLAGDRGADVLARVLGDGHDVTSCETDADAG
jgi:hypothetical protein